MKKPADAAAFADVMKRFSVFYQPSADGRISAHQRRLSGLTARQGERVAGETAVLQERLTAELLDH